LFLSRPIVLRQPDGDVEVKPHGESFGDDVEIVEVQMKTLPSLITALIGRQNNIGTFRIEIAMASIVSIAEKKYPWQRSTDPPHFEHLLAVHVSFPCHSNS
jgi:hypothetical protein